MATSTQISNYDDPAVAQQAKNLTKAIFQHESGTNYNQGLDGSTGGDAGTSKGAGQWQAATWKEQAQDVLGDANAPMTKENQSVVAQGTIRKLIAQGKNAAQIAAIWNSGNDTNWQNKVGVTTINGQQIKYNVPKYVKDVTDLYQQYKGQSGSQNPPPGAQDATQGGLTPVDQQSAQDTGATFPVTTQELNSGNLLTTTAKAVGNLPSSFAHLGGGLLNAALHPIKTVEGIGSGLVGGAENLVGANKDNPDQYQQTANAIGKAFADRYGSIENAARTATNDPAGVGADILSILEGGAAGIDKLAGTTGADIAANTARKGFEDFGTTGLNVMPKVGEGTATGMLNRGLSTVAKPVATTAGMLASLPVKAVGQTLGLETGAGYDPIKQGLQAASQGGDAMKSFTQALRGNTSPEELVNSARDALGQVVDQRGATYKQMLESLGKDKTTYDISPVYREVDKQLGKFGITQTKDGLDFSRSKFALDTTAQKDIENLYNYVKGYGAKAGDRTALGVDNLKQVLGGYYSPNSDYRAFVQGVKGATRNVLNDAPGYTKAMSDYSDMTDTIKDIKQSLSLGENASVETSFKKLTSALKNNDFRKQVIQGLDADTGGQLLSSIAGQRLSSIVPRGLAGAFEGGIGGLTAVTAGAGGLLPLLGLAITTSPRIVGEFVRALGLGVQGTNKLMGVLNKFASPVGASSVGMLNRLNTANNTSNSPSQ